MSETITTNSMQLMTLASLDAANSMRGLSESMKSLITLIHGFDSVLTTLHTGFKSLLFVLNASTKDIYYFDQVMGGIHDHFLKLGNLIGTISGSSKNTGQKGIGGFAGIFDETFGSLFKSQVGGKGILGGLKGILRPRNLLGTAGKAIGMGLGALGPQMLALTLIMKPVSALLQGLLEPLEPIIDLFGMVGEVLGLLLVPIVKALMDVLLPFMPLLIEIVTAFMPLIRIMLIPLMLLGNLLSAFMPLITSFIGWIGNVFQLLDFISIPIEKLSNFLSDIIERFVSGVTDWFDRSSDVIKDWFAGIWADIQYFFDDLFDDWQLNQSA